MSLPNLNFRHLQCFLKVAETENINEAARLMMVSPTAVFSTVKRIEKELGCKLFDRVGRNIRLNESGRTFREFSFQTLSRAESLQKMFAANQTAAE